MHWDRKCLSFISHKSIVPLFSMCATVAVAWKLLFVLSRSVTGDCNTAGQVLILPSETTVVFPYETWRGTNKAAFLAGS